MGALGRVGVLVVVACALAACASEGSRTDDSGGTEGADGAEDGMADSAADGVADEMADGGPLDGGAGSSVDCSPEALGEDDVVSFTTAHEVVEGRLGEVCLGNPSPVLVDAWETLAEITPPLQLTDLAVFSAFESAEDGDEVTLAFVSALDAEGSAFQMSINTDEYVDGDPLSLITLAHEFAHVFTSTSTQIDRTVEAQEACTTFDNGEGCFLLDSLITGWVDEFWDAELLASFDPDAETTSDAGRVRCELDDGFFGAYAASHPEEDFAEAFAAYVFDVEPFTEGQAARLDWIAERPGLAEFRDRAVAAGYDSLPHDFDTCGPDAG